MSTVRWPVTAAMRICYIYNMTTVTVTTQPTRGFQRLNASDVASVRVVVLDPANPTPPPRDGRGTPMVGGSLMMLDVEIVTSLLTRCFAYAGQNIRPT